MKWLRLIRVGKELTQRDVASITGISQPSYSDIERGKHKASVKNAKRIAKALDFDWKLFYEEEDKE